MKNNFFMIPLCMAISSIIIQETTLLYISIPSNMFITHPQGSHIWHDVCRWCLYYPKWHQTHNYFEGSIHEHVYLLPHRQQGNTIGTCMHSRPQQKSQVWLNTHHHPQTLSFTMNNVFSNVWDWVRHDMILIIWSWAPAWSLELWLQMVCTY